MAKATKAAVKATKAAVKATKAKATPAPVVAPPQHGNRGTPTAAPLEVNTGKAVATAVKAFSVNVAQKGSAGVATHATVGGFSIASVLRQLAAEAYPAFAVKHAATLVAALGIPLRAATLSAQVGAGRGGAKNGLAPEAYTHGPPAKLPREEVKRLLKLAGL